MTDQGVAIIGAVRTPIGKFRGALAKVPSPKLGSLAVTEALRRAKVAPGDVNEVFFGCGIQAGLGQNPARQVALGAGIPETIGSVTINMVCGSGMRATMLGASALRAGDQSLVVVGGMESMTRAPHLIPNTRDGLRYGDGAVVDSILRDSLQDAYDNSLMGITGEDIAKRYGISRLDADTYSLRSNQRAVKTMDAGLFDEETVPVPGQVTGSTEFRRDEGPRGDTTLEKLSKLKPAFTPNGVLTAGNSSQLSDGAAALVLASPEIVRERGFKPLGWIRSYHIGGIEPSRVMEAPIPTVKEHLKKLGLSISDLDLVEHNEAFSTASLALQKEFKIPDEKFNVNGGAVALGHPIGCTGARILVTLLYEMNRRKARRGLATLCMGGGNGLSTIVELN